MMILYSGHSICVVSSSSASINFQYAARHVRILIEAEQLVGNCVFV